MSDIEIKAPREQEQCLGHDKAAAVFTRAFEKNRMPHAWLLDGQRGIGKATFAFSMARKLLAPASEDPNDPQSPTFRGVANGSHPDLHVLERQHHPRTGKLQNEIVVDAVRKVGEKLHETAAWNGARVLIIDAADELNRNAANALLKLLEEPPAGVIALLVCHRPGAILPTIASRCTRLAMRPLDMEACAFVLQSGSSALGNEEIEKLSILSDGAPGHAFALREAGFLESYSALIEKISAAGNGMTLAHAIFEVLVNLHTKGGINQAAELLMVLVRQCALLATGASDDRKLFQADTEKLQSFASGRPPDHWPGIWENLQGLQGRVEHLNMNARQELLLAAIAVAGGPAETGVRTPHI